MPDAAAAAPLVVVLIGLVVLAIGLVLLQFLQFFGCFGCFGCFGSAGSAGSAGSGSGLPSAGLPGSSGQAGDPAALLLCGARLTDGRTVDVRLGGGRIEAVGTAGSLAAGGVRGCGTRVDLTGYLLLPAPAEPHTHLDTALSAEGDGPASYEAQEVQRRATEAALLQLGHGATALRAHVHVGDVQGLGALAAVLQARRSLRGLTELTTVAMPRVLTGVAGADGLSMLRDALKMGAAVVGGCPDLDPDPTGYVEAVARGRRRTRLPRRPAHRRRRPGPSRAARRDGRRAAPRVRVGPCGGLAGCPPSGPRTADQLAAAGVTVVCLPQGGCGGTDSAGHRSRTAAADGRRARRRGQWRPAGRVEPGRAR